jgi:hypothetical protein
VASVVVAGGVAYATLGVNDYPSNLAEGNGTQLFLRNDSAVFATNSIGGTWTQETDPGTASAIAAG